jgi:hypothetical protein
VWDSNLDIFELSEEFISFVVLSWSYCTVLGYTEHWSRVVSWSVHAGEATLGCLGSQIVRNHPKIAIPRNILPYSLDIWATSFKTQAE